MHIQDEDNFLATDDISKSVGRSAEHQLDEAVEDTSDQVERKKESMEVRDVLKNVDSTRNTDKSIICTVPGKFKKHQNKTKVSINTNTMFADTK